MTDFIAYLIVLMVVSALSYVAGMWTAASFRDETDEERALTIEEIARKGQS